VRKLRDTATTEKIGSDSRSTGRTLARVVHVLEAR
jgi:hypothetical protein